MSRTRIYVKGLSSGYATTLATILVGFWLTPFTLRFLDREEYAVFALATDVLMWLGLLDIGIASGLSVHAAQLSGKNDPEKLSRLASTAFYTQNLIVLIVLVLGGALAVAIPHIFPIRAGLHQTTSTLIVVLVISSAIGFSTRVFSALLFANQQVHVDNILRLALLGIRTLLTVVMLKKGLGLYSLAAASLCATVITSAMAVWRTFKCLPRLQIRWSYASWDVLKGLGGLGVWFSLGGVAGLVITSLDRVVAAKIISVESVTTLSLTGRVYALFGGLLDQVANTARPMLGQFFGQQKITEAQRVYSQVLKLSLGFSIVAAFSLWAGNEPFVIRWVGEENFGGHLLSVALAFNLICNSWVQPNRALLSSAMVIRPQTLSRIVEAVLNLGLSVLLGRYFGLIGIVVGTAIACLMTSAWYLPFRTIRLFSSSGPMFLRQEVVPLLIVAVCLLPIAFYSQNLGKQITGFSGAALGSGVTGLAGAALLWLFVLDAELRRRLIDSFRRATPPALRGALN